jgi:hypothetical protein
MACACLSDIKFRLPGFLSAKLSKERRRIDREPFLGTENQQDSGVSCGQPARGHIMTAGTPPGKYLR